MNLRDTIMHFPGSLRVGWHGVCVEGVEVLVGWVGFVLGFFSGHRMKTC